MMPWILNAAILVQFVICKTCAMMNIIFAKR